jgi:HSP20 family protein
MDLMWFNRFRKEIRRVFFSRSINVGENIKEENIKAELVNGLLKLTAPKIKPTTPEG